MNDQWLKQNQSLRMDANSELFSRERRDFHLQRYEFAKPICENKIVLDGACGTGYGSALLGTVAEKVYGVDLAPDAIEYARARYGTEKVEFHRAFVELTPFQSSSMDVVVSFETVEHTLAPAAHMMEIVRLLKPDSGQAVLSVPNAWGYTDHHFFDFDFAQLKALCSEFFASSEFYFQNPLSCQGAPGIGKFSSDDPIPAQCIVAVCSEPRKEKVANDRLEFVLSEIYKNVFARHQEFRSLLYKTNTGMAKRIINRLKTMLQSSTC